MSDQKTISLEDAVSTLHEIRRVIDRVQPHGGGVEVLRPRLALQVGAAMIAGVFLVAEFIDGSITLSFLVSRFHTSYRLFGITSMGVGLFVLIAAVVTILEIGAKSSGQDTTRYIQRHFAQLSLLSFSSDLFVKYAALCGVILALRPDWVAPLLLIFTGDYLLQGRLFSLPFKAGLIGGLLVIGVGILQFLLGSGNMLFPLAVFTAVSLLSALSTLRERRAQSLEGN